MPVAVCQLVRTRCSAGFRDLGRTVSAAILAQVLVRTSRARVKAMMSNHDEVRLLLRSLLEKAVAEVRPCSRWLPPLPAIFGSQRYRLELPSADVDMYVVVPADLLPRN